MRWVFLVLAVVFETTATTALKYSDGLRKILPSILVIICYLIAFYFFSLTLTQIPVGIAYAIWSGLGIVLISAFGIIIFKQVIDIPAIIGIVLIVLGVIVINLFSITVSG